MARNEETVKRGLDRLAAATASVIIDGGSREEACAAFQRALDQAVTQAAESDENRRIMAAYRAKAAQQNHAA